jgi:hypothetical protein
MQESGDEKLRTAKFSANGKTPSDLRQPRDPRRKSPTLIFQLPNDDDEHKSNRNSHIKMDFFSFKPFELIAPSFSHDISARE